MATKKDMQRKIDELQGVVDTTHERLDNIVHGGVIPIPDHIRLQALTEFMESLRADLRPHINYDPLE